MKEHNDFYLFYLLCVAEIFPSPKHKAPCLNIPRINMLMYGHQQWLEVTESSYLHNTWKEESECVQFLLSKLLPNNCLWTNLIQKPEKFFSYSIKVVLGVFEKEKQVGIPVHMLWNRGSFQKPSYHIEHKHNLPTRLFYFLVEIYLQCLFGMEEMN